jgi:transcriptional regulator with XRE-family HTH domain
MLRSLLGTRIRERRRQKKLSQTALAQKAGISVSYMNLIEHNHRGIAGRTLLAIADALEVSSEELSEGADHALMTHLQEAANFDGDNKVEVNRTEEFIGRFPGWAKLTETLFENVQSQNEKLQALSDRLGQDPFFADAMHMMLSNITAIQSTSDILATTDDIPKATADKFLNNMRTESTRLAETIVNLLAYFDETRSDEAQNQTKRGQSQLDSFWESRQFFLPELEQGQENKTNMDKILKDFDFEGNNEESDIEASLRRYVSVASKMPVDTFLDNAIENNFEPISISQELNIPIEDVFFRLAHLPDTYKNVEQPQFGLIECDGSGGVLFRKPLQILSLPRKSSACPLWPLYRAISQPMQPVRTFIEPPTGESFLTYSYAYRPVAGNFNLPGTVKSAMIFTPDFQLFTPAQERKSIPSIQVGINCEVCPRDNCTARRSKSILNI